MQAVLNQVITQYTSYNMPLPGRRYWTLGSPSVDCEQVTVSMLQMYLGSPGDVPEWQVEEVLAHRKSRHASPRWSFTIKWVGLGVGNNSVESLDALVDVSAEGACINDGLLVYARKHADVWQELQRRGWKPELVAD